MKVWYQQRRNRTQHDKGSANQLCYNEELLSSCDESNGDASSDESASI